MAANSFASPQLLRFKKGRKGRQQIENSITVGSKIKTVFSDFIFFFCKSNLFDVGRLSVHGIREIQFVSTLIEPFKYSMQGRPYKTFPCTDAALKEHINCLSDEIVG